MEVNNFFLHVVDLGVDRRGDEVDLREGVGQGVDAGLGHQQGHWRRKVQDENLGEAEVAWNQRNFFLAEDAFIEKTFLEDFSKTFHEHFFDGTFDAWHIHRKSLIPTLTEPNL